MRGPMLPIPSPANRRQVLDPSCRPLYWMSNSNIMDTWISTSGSLPACASSGRRAISPRGAGRSQRREPLDDLADRARRNERHRGRAGEARGRLQHHPGSPVRAAGRERRPAGTQGGPGRLARSRLRATCAATCRRAARSRRSRSSRWTFPPAPTSPTRPAAASRRAHQQVWVLEGQIDVTVGAEQHSLQEGDCLAFAARPADRLPQSHAQDRALCRGDRVVIRRLEALVRCRHRGTGRRPGRLRRRWRVGKLHVTR